MPLVAAAIAATTAALAVIVTEPTRTYADVRVGLHLVGRGVGGFAGELVVSLN